MGENYQLGFLVVLVALAIFCLILYCKLAYLTKRYQSFMLGPNGASLEASLESLHDKIKALDGAMVTNGERTQELAKALDAATRGVAVVRFNAFQETGSDLSFAVAFLDAEKNGVVISSIYGREESRTYAKPLEDGQSSYPLGSEEQEAIRKASAALHPLFPATGRKEKR